MRVMLLTAHRKQTVEMQKNESKVQFLHPTCFRLNFLSPKYKGLSIIAQAHPNHEGSVFDCASEADGGHSKGREQG